MGPPVGMMVFVALMATALLAIPGKNRRDYIG
jgi:hypothetical protein